MPVIVLGGSSGGIPIDPTFDDGGVIQLLDPDVPLVQSLSTGQLINIGDATITIGITGSATFIGDVEETLSPTVIHTDVVFSTGVIYTLSPFVTPNLPPVIPTPTPSAPDGGPTVNDFTDTGAVTLDATVLFSEALSTGVVSEFDPIIPPPVNAGSSTFTQGTVLSGTTPIPEFDPIVPAIPDSTIIAPDITVVNPTVVS